METENGGYRMSSVKRVYVEKKPEYAVRAKELQSEIRSYLGISEIGRASCRERV